jgi:hypothetical protein
MSLVEHQDVASRAKASRGLPAASRTMTKRF